MGELLKAVGKDGKKSLKRLEEITENCPACILAAIRISGVNEPPDNPATDWHQGAWIDFDFKGYSKGFWSSHNEGVRENRYV